MENRQRRFNYQKTERCRYDHKKANMSTSSKEKVSKFKGLIKDGPFFICVVCHRCLYRRSVVIFGQSKSSLELPPLFCVKSFDSSTYFVKLVVKNVENVKYFVSQYQTS